MAGWQCSCATSATWTTSSPAVACTTAPAGSSSSSTRTMATFRAATHPSQPSAPSR
jgi:hypothetical protein